MHRVAISRSTPGRNCKTLTITKLLRSCLAYVSSIRTFDQCIIYLCKLSLWRIFTYIMVLFTWWKSILSFCSLFPFVVQRVYCLTMPSGKYIGLAISLLKHSWPYCVTERDTDDPWVSGRNVAQDIRRYSPGTDMHKTVFLRPICLPATPRPMSPQSKPLIERCLQHKQVTKT